MQNLKLKPFIYILLVVSGIFWFVFAKLSGLNLAEVFDFFKILPKVAGIDLLIVGIFIKWGWRWKIFGGWLVPFPDLNGTWHGEIKSTWKNPETGEVLDKIPAILTIRQSFTKISCVMRTAEMTSYSYSESFKLEGDQQIRQLSYSYTSKPKTTITDRSPLHEGSIVFDIIGNPVEKLVGQYWSARKTTGEVLMAFLEKDLLEEFPEYLGKHPMSG